MAKKKTSKGKVVAEVGAGIAAAGAAAAAAGYYLYGSKNAKKNRMVVAKELKADWKILQNEAKKIRVSSADISRAKAVGKRMLAGRKAVLARGKKIVKKITRKAKTAARKIR